MILLSSILCFCSSIYHIRINRGKIVSVGAIISLLWALVLLVGAFCPFDWYPVGEKCGTVILLGTLSLVAGLFTLKKIDKSRQLPVFSKHDSNKKSYRLLFALQIILVIALIPIMIKAFKILVDSHFSMSYLRGEYASGGENGSYMTTLERLFYIHYFIGPLLCVCIMYNSILFFKFKLWIKPLAYNVLLTLCYSLISAGRSTIFFAILSLFVSFILFMLKQGDKKEKKKALLFFGIILSLSIILLGIITIYRGSGTDSAFSYIFKTVITYFCGGTRVLNQTLEYSQLYGINIQTYGYSSISGFFSIVNTLNLYIFNILPNNFAASFRVQDYLIDNISIGTNSSMNAFPTMYYFFIRDGGIAFMCIITFVFGRLVTFVQNKSIVSSSLFLNFLYCLLFYTAIMTVCWWEPIRVEFWMILFWGWIISLLMKINGRQKKGIHYENSFN